MPDILTAYAASQPDKLGVVSDDGHGQVVAWTYAQFESEANRIANALASLGAGPGQKVIWCGPNSPQIVAAMSATRKIGAVAVPLNYRLTPEEARHIIGHCDATLAYVDAEFAGLFTSSGDNASRDNPSGDNAADQHLSKLRQVIVFGGPPPPGMLGDDFVAAVSADPPALSDEDAGGSTMIYTSGTTGKPKGAVRHRGDEQAALALMALIGYTPDDVYLTSGPLYHSGPMAFMGAALAFGQTIVVQRKFDPEDWLRLVDAYGVTSTFAAPAPIRLVCALPDEIKKRYDRSTMKRMLANAAPWSFALKQRYLRDFPADSLWEIYGSTELGVNCVLKPQDQLRKPGSCGRPAPGVEIALLDDAGQEVTGTGPDHPGELFVRSGSVFNEYYKQPDSYAAARRGDFHTVGDIAYRDDEGFLYICDRKTDMIISGGMNIYPAEIEAALEQHPDIFDAAVFGIPSEEWGELVHATVVLAPGASLTEADVVAHARAHLASYKLPRSVAFAAELPRTGSGKILKRQLRAPYWEHRTSQVG
jgi:acyl-CoA synthetase (AMP-forming)/AMP-acid ligase II